VPPPPMISDTSDLRELMCALLPGLAISSAPSKSGQRVVYFCTFDASKAPKSLVQKGEVVLKVSQCLSAQQIAYLEREIDVLKSLKSDFYPEHYSKYTFTHDPRTRDILAERLFVTLEQRIDAVPLNDVVANYKSPRQALVLLSQLIEALEPLWLHKQKLVHRDLKPANILIRPNGKVAIIDLGIVREEGSVGVTNSFMVAGPCTPPYASPEQATNDKRNISFKSDFFSLGIIVYELISGVSPFLTEKKDAMSVLHSVVNHSPRTLLDVSGAPDSVSAIVEKMMQKEPYRRHRTVDILKTEIKNAIATL